eukprot:scaffold3065_cov389-Prasinococcus_capsulatus_cf.AAC.16
MMHERLDRSYRWFSSDAPGGETHCQLLTQANHGLRIELTAFSLCASHPMILPSRIGRHRSANG